MSESFNYAPVATLAVFVLGVLFTPLLRKWDFFLNSGRKKKLLLSEIADCTDYLKDVIDDYFKLIYTLKTASDAQGAIGRVPIPVLKDFDLGFIQDFYKESLSSLTQDQRKLVRSIPHYLKQLKDLSDDFKSQVLNEEYYNIRGARNVLWSACYLHHELSKLILLKGKYKSNDDLNSITATKNVLTSFGISDEDIKESSALKSMLTDEQLENFSGKSTFQIPE